MTPPTTPRLQSRAPRRAAAFERVTLLDRRKTPSHGYRAFHLVVREGNKPIEVQVRTTLQHIWAEMCEKCADVIDPAVKYGGGPAMVRGVLDRAAEHVRRIEKVESEVARTGAVYSALANELRDVRNDYVMDLQAFIADLTESDRGSSS